MPTNEETHTHTRFSTLILFGSPSGSLRWARVLSLSKHKTHPMKYGSHEHFVFEPNSFPFESNFLTRCEEQELAVCARAKGIANKNSAKERKTLSFLVEENLFVHT